MTAQTMQIGNRPCRIYGEAHAEYLLLQMTGEHELQSMESAVTRGNLLRCGAKKVSAAMRRAHYAF